MNGKTIDGPLRVSPDNPRYFTDDSGEAIYLCGAHTWDNLVDCGIGDPPARFDYEDFLQRLDEWGHNCFRLWRWELMNGVDTHTHGTEGNHIAPHPWMRTGPGEGVDGNPRFDLTKFDPKYFERLRSRVAAAGQRGMYAIVMLFEGWGLRYADRTDGHPFDRKNNSNGIHYGDALPEIQTLKHPQITRLQEFYVRKVVEAVNEFDNVLYEISNETSDEATEWQYHMIRFVRECEADLPKHHPVGMTFQMVREYVKNKTKGTNELLFGSSAEWISPGIDPQETYRHDPPPAAGDKVILLDTDHLWGIGGDADWVWESFTRGYNVLYMDVWNTTGTAHENQDEMRIALGQTNRYAQRMDLRRAVPRTDISSTGFALADPGREYLIYCPTGGELTAEIEPGNYAFEWLACRSGEISESGEIELPAGTSEFTCPVSGRCALYLKRIP